MSTKRFNIVRSLIGGIMFFLISTYAAVPVIPDASPEAQALLNYIYDMYGKKILSGQMYAPWAKIDETEYVYQTTGKYPAIRGQDLINESANNNEIQDAIDWWKAGGIPTIMWHWGAPTVGEGYEASKNNGKPLAAGYVDKCLTVGTNENREMMLDLDRIAAHLLKLKKANVPVIWRPMHECSGGWFWWDMNGGEGFKKLWKFMFDYYTKTKGLNNLIWFLGYDGSADNGYNPGTGYYDLVGTDTYGDNSAHESMYKAVKAIHGSTMPIVYHECGTPPNPDLCKSKDAMWSWFMVWHTEHIFGVDKNYLKSVYAHDLVITRDEVPNIMAEYGPAVATKSVSQITGSNVTFNRNKVSIDGTAQKSNYTLSLFDLNGKLIYRKVVSGSSALPISSVAAKGSYIIVVKNSSIKLLNKKIVFN
ncbi:MAG: hypothetical protein JW915_00815 [Chitinispirillaceae bacterium]|nr:hypothetical protein [Chitinispirillaceae bacterium]